MLALKKNPDDRIFNLGSGKGYTLLDILEILEKVSGKKPKVVFKEKRNIDVPVNILDNKLISETLDWQPKTDIYEGIEKTYKYLKKELL